MSGEIKRALTDKDQWALFVGHLVLALIVLWPILYFSVGSVASNAAEEKVTSIKTEIKEVTSSITTIERQQAINIEKIKNIEGDVDEIKEGQKEANKKLDELLRAVLNGNSGRN